MRSRIVIRPVGFGREAVGVVVRRNVALAPGIPSGGRVRVLQWS